MVNNMDINLYSNKNKPEKSNQLSFGIVLQSYFRDGVTYKFVFHSFVAVVIWNLIDKKNKKINPPILNFRQNVLFTTNKK